MRDVIRAAQVSKRVERTKLNSIELGPSFEHEHAVVIRVGHVDPAVRVHREAPWRAERTEGVAVSVVGGDSVADGDGNISVRATIIDLSDGVTVSTDDVSRTSDAGALQLIAGARVSVGILSVVSTDEGTLTLSGNSAGTFAATSEGVRLVQSTLQTDGGSIFVTGHGGSSGANNHGVSVSSAVVQSSPSIALCKASMPQSLTSSMKTLKAGSSNWIRSTPSAASSRAS